MTVPFQDIPLQIRALREEFDAAIDGVLRHGHFILGPEVTAFEAEWARFCGAKHAIGVADGTMGLLLPLMAMGLKPGDEVVAIDPRYFRPTEVDLLLGDPTKSREKLGWKPKYDVNALLREMVDADLDLMRGESHLKKGGFRVYNFHE